MKRAEEISNALRFAPAIRSRIAKELAVSLPIASKYNGEVVGISFYFGRLLKPPKTEVQLYPPSWIAMASWTSGEIIAVEPKPADFFGIPGDRFTPFATTSYYDLNIEAQAQGLGNPKMREAELYYLYDQILPAWITGEKPEPAFIDRFLLLLRSLTERPLDSVYAGLGKEFFDWLAANRQPQPQ